MSGYKTSTDIYNAIEELVDMVGEKAILDELLQWLSKDEKHAFIDDFVRLNDIELTDWDDDDDDDEGGFD